MAFCPHCGKPTTKEATKCIACGKDIGVQKKAARFAGTMMMSANDAAVDAGLRAAPPKAPQPASVPPPPAAAAAAPPAPPAPAVPAPPPRKLAATMMGTGLPGAAGAARAGVPAGAPVMRDSETLADTVPRNADEAAPARRAGAAVEGASEGKYLVGDPMAPSPAAQAAARRASATQRGDDAGSAGNRWLMIVLFGLAIIGGIGYAAASFLGLL